MSQSTHKLPIRKRGRKWQVDMRKLGKGQDTYPTKAQAEGAAQAAWNDHQAAERENVDFSDKQRSAAIQAYRELAKGASAPVPADELIEAARYYVEYGRPHVSKKTVSALVDEFMQSHRGAENAEVTIKEYEYKLRRFARAFGERNVHEINTSEIEKWMDAQGFKSYNRKNYRNYLRIFFRFGEQRGYLKKSPAAAIPRVKIKKTAPGVLTADEVESLLIAARDYRNGIMLPYFAIGCLAGLRPDEMKRITWADIDMEEKEIYVSVAASKTASDRTVTMQECLLEWLELIPKPLRDGKLVFSRGKFERVRENAGLTEKWKKTKDIMRHSAASHLYRCSGSADVVTANMGHDLHVFLKYYKREVGKRDAERYFQILPVEKGKLIRLFA